MEKDFLVALLEAINRIAHHVFDFIKAWCN